MQSHERVIQDLTEEYDQKLQEEQVSEDFMWAQLFCTSAKWWVNDGTLTSSCAIWSRSSLLAITSPKQMCVLLCLHYRGETLTVEHC